MKNNFPYINRKIEKNIIEYLNSPEIIAIIGPRQCGKTTLLNHIFEQLPDNEKNIISFEDIDELKLFEEDIKSFAKLHINSYKYLFIDEFQYAKDGGKKLKFLYDQYNIKIFITGSSSTELSIQSIKFLVGRIFVFNLYPFSFEEFLNYKNTELYNLITESLINSSQIIERVNQYYKEFVIYGGYPRVILSLKSDEKLIVLKNIYNTYILKEIKQILQFNEDHKLIKLIQAIALQTGSQINLNELSSLTGFCYKELLNAINILEKTYIIIKCPPFFKNKRLELVKAPKFFFHDNGFRNIILQNFLPLTKRTDQGELNENFIASELIKNDLPVLYWRTKSKAEVDFVIEKHEKLLPVEVKSNLKKTKITKSFHSFINKYLPQHGIIASNELLDNKKLEDTLVHFLPHWYVNIYLKKKGL